MTEAISETPEPFHMADVGNKAVTARTAIARGTLLMGEKAFGLLKFNRLPKGDALKLGEMAGLLAAKRTPDSIPLCHPIPLDKIRLRFELDGALPGIHAFCEVSAHAKTGVEMEALSGVMGALLTVYDLVKPVDPALTATDIRLICKEGGKSGIWRHPEEHSHRRAPHPHSRPFGERENNAHSAVPGSCTMKDDHAISAPLPLVGEGGGEGQRKLGKAGVITVSDRCSAGKARDISGPILTEGLRTMGFEIGAPIIVPDEKKEILKVLRRLAGHCEVVLLTGGTGLSTRDVTPEAVESACSRLIPGIGEALRSAGMASTPMSSLSRSVAGLMGRTLVVALPGSSGGVRDGLEVLADILPHAVHIAKDGKHE